MMPADFLTHVAGRLDRLDAEARRIRMSGIKTACYLALGGSEPRRSRAVIACIEAGLLDSPIDTLADDIQRVIDEVTA